MKERIHYNTESNETADELTNMGADMDRASKVELLAGEMQDERKKPNKVSSTQIIVM